MGKQRGPVMRPYFSFRHVVYAAIAAAGLLVTAAPAQVFVVGSFDPKLTPQPYEKTNIALSQQHITTRTRQEVLRIMQAETAFSMRALPLGHHGMVIHANGAVTPDGADYRKAIQDFGVSVEPGKKALVTNVVIESDRIIFDLNGGPDKKHHWLQHIAIGGAGGSRQLAPDEPDATGCRVTLIFKDYVPELTGAQIKSLLRPVLDFSLKSPLQAYTDTLPPKLKKAVLEHRVLVGMDREMVLQAVNQPDRKVHEKDGQGNLYDEWIYGTAPHDIQLVRFYGDRVVRVETAAIGKEPVIRDTDETDGYLASKGPPTRDVPEGDTSAEHRAPPTLRKPSEPVPADAPQPVQMPPGTQNFGVI